MFKHKYHVALTAAALMTLAACGSGTDSEGSAATQISPNGGGATLKAEAPQASDGAATAANDQGNAGNDAAADNANTGATTPEGAAAASTLAASSPAAAAAMANNPVAAAEAAASSPVVSASEGTEATAADAEPIAHDTVRADVILSMLDQRSCDRQYHATGPETGVRGGGSYPRISTSNWMDPDNYRKISGHALADTSAFCNPSIYRYSALAAGSYTVKDQEALDWVEHRYLGTTTEHRFNEWTAKIPLTVTADGFSLGAQVEGNANVDTHNGKGRPTVGSPQNLKLTSDKPFTAKSAARVRYGTLSVWKDARGHTYQLMLLPGNTGEAKLCWNTNNETVKRLTCTTWAAPQGWKRGQLLQQTNHYVVDDRTTYGETGLIYFSSRVK